MTKKKSVPPLTLPPLLPPLSGGFGGVCFGGVLAAVCLCAEDVAMTAGLVMMGGAGTPGVERVMGTVAPPLGRKYNFRADRWQCATMRAWALFRKFNCV